MTLKIERIAGKRSIRIRLSGELRCADLDQVKAEIDRGGGPIVLDLQELDLVDLKAIRFLNACRAEGMNLVHCSPYIREWMLRERAEGKNEQNA